MCFFGMWFLPRSAWALGNLLKDLFSRKLCAHVHMCAHTPPHACTHTQFYFYPGMPGTPRLGNFKALRTSLIGGCLVLLGEPGAPHLAVLPRVAPQGRLATLNGPCCHHARFPWQSGLGEAGWGAGTRSCLLHKSCSTPWRQLADQNDFFSQ